METNRQILGKEVYDYERSRNPETTPEEEIILKSIKQLNGTDSKKEGIYYLILTALIIYVEKEDTSYKERLKLAELVKFLYNQEEKGLILKDKYNFSKKYEIDKKQIIEFRKVVMKQLSETYYFIKAANSKDDPVSPKDFWDWIPILIWDFENDKIEVYDFSHHAREYLKIKENGLPEGIPLTKQGIDNIIKIEQNRHIVKSKNYIGRLLSFIDKYSKKYGYFDNELNTISTEEACFLYDTFDLIGLIQGDYSANKQEKYQYIKRELKKAKI